jgi:hypothetical protein
MNGDSLIPLNGRSHLPGGQVVGRRDLVDERGLALLGLGPGPGRGERRLSIARGRSESCRVPSRDAPGLENIYGKMFAVDGSREVDVATWVRRHHAQSGRPRGPHCDGHHGDSERGDLRGEWHPNQSCTSSPGRTEEGVQNSTRRANARLLGSEL